MPNLVGIGNSQVPTNAMLGGLAYQDSVGEIVIDKIKAKTSDTAVDIFVYDTRKDSDGGAWRKRATTQSWYNEGASATRGARKEFPAVAIIVIETYELVIYDGDDPNLPMWMRFEMNQLESPIANMGKTPFGLGFTNAHPHNNLNLSCVHMLNGYLFIGANRDANTNQLQAGYDVNFISEIMHEYLHYPTNASAASKWRLAGKLIDRNRTDLSDSPTSRYGAGTAFRDMVNDVDMIVLPNAPIDQFSGLPVPTVALGTEEGASVVKDDGNVFDITVTNSGYTGVTQINIDDKFVYIGFSASNLYIGGIGYAVQIPSADVSLGNIINATSNANFRWSNNSTSGSGQQSDYYINPSDSNDDDVKEMALTKRGMSFATESGASIVLNDQSDENGSVAFITSSFNSGYMHGDIKGAFLSDTDTTNITSGEILSNGDFTNGTTGWTLQNASEGSISVSSNQLTLNNTTSSDPPVCCYQQISLEVGQYYNLTSVHASGNVSVVNIATGTSNGGGTGGYGNVVYHDAAGSTRSATFLATHATMYCYIRVNTNGTGTTVINSVSIRKAEEDRSVNGAFARDNVSALTINGTVPKQVVATGAELVSYGPFSTSNRLRQPYNSDLNFEANDFSVMFWMYNTGSNIHQTLVGRDNREFSVDILDNTSYNRRFRIYAFNSSNGLQTFDSEDDPFLPNTWTHICVNYTGGNTAAVYVNGVLNKTGTLNYDIDDTSNGLNIGCRNTGGTYAHAATGTQLSLVRISKGAPSADQVKKIYNDERDLYNENAKCTLHGTSDNVKTIAFDDSNGVLHVGTSSGRSEFQGLSRINNTTTAVTTAISASNGLVAEQ